MTKKSLSLKNLGRELKTYWSVPKPGKYVPYKEYFSIFGAINFNYAMQVPKDYIAFAANCYLIMYHYNLPYLTFSVITLIGLPLSYMWNILGWMVADNLGFLPKKTERKFLIFYGAFALVGILLMALNLSSLIPQGSAVASFVNTLSGVNTKTIFNIFGAQIFLNGYGGIRNILWRKKLLPKYGRYKYKIYSETWQKAIMYILVGWLPIYKMGDVCERVWLCYLLIAMFNAYDAGNHSESVADLCSPDSEERFLIRTWPIKLSHLCNSLLAFLLPVIIALFPDKFADINIYRYVLPITYIICGALTMFFAPKIKERIPQPAIEKKVQIGFWDGIFGVMRNKYRWITTADSLIDSLGDGMLSITTILMLYTLRADGIIYSAITMLLAFAGTPFSFLAPYFTKKFKYKYLKITELVVKGISTLLNVVAVYYFSTNYILMSTVMILSIFFQRMITSIPEAAKKEATLRINDYQMYISGERLESFSGIFSTIISPVTTIVGLIIPIILLKGGYNSNWDILFYDSSRAIVICIPLIIDAVGKFLSVIPYLFWDYDDKKHKMVVDELKRRARILGGEDFDAEAAKARQAKEAKVNTTESVSEIA